MQTLSDQDVIEILKPTNNEIRWKVFIEHIDEKRKPSFNKLMEALKTINQPEVVLHLSGSKQEGWYKIIKLNQI